MTDAKGGGAATKPTPKLSGTARGYVHLGTEAVSRPAIGAAPRFKVKKPPTTYRYDSSMSPALDWDTNPARELAAFLMACIIDAAALAAPHEFPARRVMRGADGSTLAEVTGLHDAVERLRRLQAPFLNWSGKAERMSFDVPTFPLFVHERLSTTAIIETLATHKRKVAQVDMFDMFADPQRPMAEQVRAFEHRDQWVNRMILGDSLVVMNSLLRFEGLSGQVQCIFMDPPYGVKFGSNFQPFVRKRDVAHGDDTDMTREPEMVQAYRDTWELGLHSYLTYLRDRLALARDLLTETGSLFVQISDENLHHVRQVMDEIFGAQNFISVIAVSKTSGLSSPQARTLTLATTTDFIVWYARDADRIKFHQLFRGKDAGKSYAEVFRHVQLLDGLRRPITSEESRNGLLPEGARLFALSDVTAQNDNQTYDYTFEGKIYRVRRRGWRTTKIGMDRLVAAKRIVPVGDGLRYIQFAQDFPVSPIHNLWDDTGTGSFLDDKLYVVQTATKAVQRCVLMTTDPGDLVLDPTCGSGTTAYVAEQWGRRWITIDTSRVPLALARQRLLTATFPWYRLTNEKGGPSSGFKYVRRQNRKGEEVGGIVPHVTLKSIANNEAAHEEVLVDQPEQDNSITRVTGPFVVEACLPTPQALDGAEQSVGSNSDEPGDHIARMIEVLRKSPTFALPSNRRITLKSIRRPARTLSLSAEATVDGDANGGAVRLDAAIEAAHETNTNGLPFSTQQVAILFGPADGPVSAKAVLDAAKEANTKNYRHLFVIGFQITAEARREIDAGEDALGLPATYVSATMDLQLGDLLKTQRSSQIFAVCGQPDVDVLALPPAQDGDGTPRWQIRLRGLDVFDPVTMETDHRDGTDVPAWMLDAAWNGMVFHADQVFFPRTSAWNGLRRALKATHDDSVWAHLSGDISAPFEAALATEIAVKVIDDRGNELMVTKRLHRG